MNPMNTTIHFIIHFLPFVYPCFDNILQFDLFFTAILHQQIQVTRFYEAIFSIFKNAKTKNICFCFRNDFMTNFY